MHEYKNLQVSPKIHQRLKICATELDEKMFDLTNSLLENQLQIVEDNIKVLRERDDDVRKQAEKVKESESALITFMADFQKRTGKFPNKEEKEEWKKQQGRQVESRRDRDHDD